MKKKRKILAILAVLIIVAVSLSSKVQASQILASQSFSGTSIDQIEKLLPAIQGDDDDGESSNDERDESMEMEHHEESEDSDTESYGAGESGSISDDDLHGEDKDDDKDEDEDDDDIALGGSSILGNVGIAGVLLVTLAFLSQSASGVISRAKNWLKRD